MGEGPSLSRLSLRFRDTSQERAYREDFAQGHLIQLRIVLVFMTVCTALLGFIDVPLIQNMSLVHWVWWVRYSALIPAMLCVLGLTFARRERVVRWFQAIAAVPAVVAFGSLFMHALVLAPAPERM